MIIEPERLFLREMTNRELDAFYKVLAWALENSFKVIWSWWQIGMQLLGDPHPEIPTPFSFLTITIHDKPLSDSLKGGGKFSTLWEFCGKNVGKTRSHHQFAARWRNRRKSGNLSTKKPTFQSVIIKNGGGRWIRTIELGESRFTVCRLWPLGNPTDKIWSG